MSRKAIRSPHFKLVELSEGSSPSVVVPIKFSILNILLTVNIKNLSYDVENDIINFNISLINGINLFFTIDEYLNCKYYGMFKGKYVEYENNNLIYSFDKVFKEIEFSRINDFLVDLSEIKHREE